MANGEAGKGDGYRPVNKKRYDKNYERIFGKKDGGFVCLGGDFAKDYRKAIKNGRQNKTVNS